MKAVSLRQPWASAVAWGGKRLENRLERSSAITQIRAVIGQRVAIHASLSKPSEAVRRYFRDAWRTLHTGPAVLDDSFRLCWTIGTPRRGD